LYNVAVKESGLSNLVTTLSFFYDARRKEAIRVEFRNPCHWRHWWPLRELQQAT